MTNLNSFCRLAAGRALALSWLIAGLVAPAYCVDPPPPGAGDLAQARIASWMPTGNLNTARVGHTATLLPNGKVLVAGGSSGNGPLDTAELYDPATGTWSATGRLHHPRSDHTATLLPGGEVLVAAGITDDYDYSGMTAELYDPGTGTWRYTGEMSGSRVGHTATLLRTGKVLVAGGFNQGYLPYVESFDPATGTWSRGGSLVTPREGHTATLLPNDKVLIAGGWNDIWAEDPLANAELFDPAAGTSSSTARLNASGFGHSATLLQDGRVLIVGGSNVGAPTSARAELYDPVTGKRSPAAIPGMPGYGHTATLLPDGRVLIAGGWQWNPRDDGRLVYVSEAQLYDPSRGQWDSAGNLNTPRTGHTATLLPDGNVLVAGGTSTGTRSPDYGHALAAAELYKGAIAPWTIGPGITGAWYDPAQNGHGLFIEVLDNSRLLAWWFTFNPTGTEQAWFGGVGTYSGNTATLTEVYQTSNGRWIPNFDASQIVNKPWGTLNLTFSDCTRGRADFSSVAGYGAGSMNLTRLTQPAGLACP